MQRSQHDQVARPLFEHLIEVPDFEMAAHADQQRALAHTPPRAHPRGDAEPALAIHLRGRNEAQAPPQQRVARPAVPRTLAAKLRQRAMLVGDATTIVDQHARIIGVETDEQVLARLSCLYRNAEMLGKDQFATRADRRNRTSHEEFVHDRYTLNNDEVSTSQCFRILYPEAVDLLCQRAVDAALTK
ncbi:MAG: hypothetical protein V4595_12135 [Pseudomonadota bacterium]|jgi:hypothetical protein